MVNKIRAVLAAHPRAEWLIPLACCLILLTQMLFSVRQMSQHADEATHLYAGYRVLKCRDYTYGREHPPLAKMLAALPLLASNPPMDCVRGAAGYDEEDQATNWLYSQANWWQLLMEARVASSLSAVALCMGVWIVARRMFGRAVAVVSTVALAFEPNILAHGALVLNNILLTALFLFTVFSLYLWTRQRSVPLLVGTGVLTGLTLLTKHSAVLLVPTLILLAAIEPWLEKSARTEAANRMLRNLGAGGGDWRDRGSDDLVLLWPALRGRDAGDRGTACRDEIRRGAIPEGCGSRPSSSADYLEGRWKCAAWWIRRGREYSLGRAYSQAPWYWFPVTISVKFTLALLVMLATGAVGLIAYGGERKQELLFVLLPAGLYLTASLCVQRTIVWIGICFHCFHFC